MQFKNKFKTARCILRCNDQFLLAVHSSFWSRPNRRWGLPGGNIEWREAPEVAAKREIMEEFDLTLGDLTEIGAYPYKGHQHMVYGAEIPQQISYYDDTELLEIGWFGLQEAWDLHAQQKLHAGYELDAIEAYLALQKGS